MDQKARFIQKAVRDTLLQRLLKGRAREVEALPELLRRQQPRDGQQVRAGHGDQSGEDIRRFQLGRQLLGNR